MVKKQGADVDLKIDALREEMRDGFGSLNGRVGSLEQKFDSLDQKVEALDQKVEALDQKVDRVAVELVRTQSDVRDIRETMATKSDINRILGAIDAFAAKTEYGDRSRALHGQTLVEVELTLKDHEKRLGNLEAPRPPTRL